ncbi:MAG: sugar phosphate nucleotidyltransferase [bacterium]
MSNLKHTAAIILAAGKGSRMHAKLKNKVAFVLDGQPMVARAATNLRLAGVGQIIAVVGFAADSVKKALGDQVTYVTQSEQLGTGHAIKTALPAMAPEMTTVLSVYGDDSAFYPATLYESMIHKLIESGSGLLFLTIIKEDPFGLGRIIRDNVGNVLRIVEEKNATEKEKQIQEINTGFYCFKRDFLEKYICEITQNEISGEYYLTDLVEIALKHGEKVDTYRADSNLWHGVNNRSDFAKARVKISKNYE